MNQMVTSNEDALLKSKWRDVKGMPDEARLRYLQGVVEASSSRSDLCRRLGVQRSWGGKICSRYELDMSKFNKGLSARVEELYYVGITARELRELSGASEGTVYAVGRKNGWVFEPKVEDGELPVMSTPADFAAMENAAMMTGHRTAYRIAGGEG